MFWNKKNKRNVIQIDRNEMYPVIHASICNGEKVAGFKSRKDGRFVEIGLIRTDADLNEFMTDYGLKREDIIKEY